MNSVNIQAWIFTDWVIRVDFEIRVAIIAFTGLTRGANGVAIGA